MIDPWRTLASLILILIAIAISHWRGLEVERSIAWASLRAAVQLLAVGLLFTAIFESAFASWWSALWILGMTLIATQVVVARAPEVPGLRVAAFAAVALSTAVSLAVVFGSGMLDFEPVSVVVIAGITVGNALPAAVLAAKHLVDYLREQRDQVEGLLALGFDARGAGRFVSAQAARNALLPQIERTKVVGLVALPGAMTGLLLAGVEPFEAVLTQIVVMFLVLGAAAISVVTVVAVIAARAFTPDVRLAAWTVYGPEQPA